MGLRGTAGRLGDASRAGWSEAGRDPAARGRPGLPLLRRAQPPSPGARLPSPRPLGPWPAGRDGSGDGERRGQDPVRHPRGPLPFPGSRSPGRQEAEPAGQSRPPSPRARLRRGSDSARGSAMEPPRAPLEPCGERRMPSTSSTAQAWRLRPWRSEEELMAL